MVKVGGLVTLACVLASTGCQVTLNGENVVVRDERRFTVTGEPDLTLTTYDGSVQVRSWDRDEVLVEIEKRGPTEDEATALEVRFTQDGNRIRVEVPAPRVERERFGAGTSVSLFVSAPRKMTLNVETGDGSIAADDLDGVIHLRSGDGSVRADTIAGDLRISTGDGSVRAARVTGRAQLSSGDGSIAANGRFNALRADTGDGSLTIESDEGSTMDEDWDLTTGDGSITLRVPSGFNAAVDAESGDGSVSADGLSQEASSRGEGSRTLKGQFGTGGRLIRLRSGDGSIRISGR